MQNNTADDLRVESKSNGFLGNLHPLHKWKAIFTMSFVATVLTILELVVIYKIVFADIETQLENVLKSQVTKVEGDSVPLLNLFDSVLGTVYLRERDTNASLNFLVFSLACMFVLTLAIFTLYAGIKLRSIHNNKMNRSATEESMAAVYANALVSAFLTLFLIGLFQGFPCLIDPKSALCVSNAFFMFSSKWIFNEDYIGMIWDTGLCSGYNPYESKYDTLEGMLIDEVSPYVTQDVQEDIKDKVQTTLDTDVNASVITDILEQTGMEGSNTLLAR